MITRDDVISAARRYVGRPFQFGGRGSPGLDCIAIGLLPMRDLDADGWETIWNDPDVHLYARVRAPGYLRRKFDHFVELGILRRVNKEALGPADIALSFAGVNKDHHTLMLTKPGWYIEASNRPEKRFPAGRVLETRFTPLRWQMLLGGYQIAGID